MNIIRQKPLNILELQKNISYAVQNLHMCYLGDEYEVMEREKIEKALVGYHTQAGIQYTAIKLREIFENLLPSLQSQEQKTQLDTLIKFKAILVIYDRVLCYHNGIDMNERDSFHFMDDMIKRVDTLILPLLNSKQEEIDRIVNRFNELHQKTIVERSKLASEIQATLSVLEANEKFFETVKTTTLLYFDLFFVFGKMLDTSDIAPSEELIERTFQDKRTGNPIQPFIFARIREKPEEPEEGVLDSVPLEVTDNHSRRTVLVETRPKEAPTLTGASLERVLNFLGTLPEDNLMVALLISKAFYYEESIGHYILSATRLRQEQRKIVIDYLREQLEKPGFKNSPVYIRLLYWLLRSGTAVEKNRNMIPSLAASFKTCQKVDGFVSPGVRAAFEEISAYTNLSSASGSFRMYCNSIIQINALTIMDIFRYPSHIEHNESVTHYETMRPLMANLYKRLYSLLLDAKMLGGMTTKEKLQFLSFRNSLWNEGKLSEPSFYKLEAAKLPSSEEDKGFLPPGINLPRKQPVLKPKKEKRVPRVSFETGSSSASSSSEASSSQVMEVVEEAGLQKITAAPSSKEKAKLLEPAPLQIKKHNFHYDQRVTDWFHDQDKMLAQAQYLEYTPEEKQRAIAVHTFAQAVDDLVFSHSSHEKWENAKRKTFDDHYSLAGVIIKDGKATPVVFTYCFGAKDKVCYHRHYYSGKKAADLVAEYVKDKKWKTEHPPLEITEFELKRSKNSLHDDGSRIVDSKNPYFTEIFDPRDGGSIIRVFNGNFDL